MEKLDLYDINKSRTGEILERGKDIPKDRYRLVVHILVFNSKGEMLIQQRVSTKSKYPNKWDISVGGCVKSGETSFEGAERELSEELGLKVDFSHKVPNISINFKTGFDDYYVVFSDIDSKDIVFQKEEVQTVKWANKEEIKKLLADGEFIGYRPALVDFWFDLARKEYGSFYIDD